jgi:hypothetical protein
MRIICPIHDSQSVVQISPDVWGDPKSGDVVRVVYKFDGQSVDSFTLSVDFAKANNVTSGVVPLPSEYPEWVKSVVLVCERCFDEKMDTPAKTE